MRTITIAVLLILSLICAVILQQRRLGSLQSENSRLQANQAASNADAEQASATHIPKSNDVNTAPEHMELLRLRGEVNILRRQLSETSNSLSRAKTQLRQGGPAAKYEPTAEERDAERVNGIARMTTVKQWMLAFNMFADDNGGKAGKFPERFDQVLAYTGGLDPGVECDLATNRLEILYSGSPSTLANPAKVIAIREREARPTPGNRGWSKTYGFADGHSEIHVEPTQDFSQWEGERIFSK